MQIIGIHSHLWFIKKKKKMHIEVLQCLITTIFPYDDIVPFGSDKCFVSGS